MTNYPTYNDSRSRDRLFLLIAAIGRNPGIANLHQCQELGKEPMAILLEVMSELAFDIGIEMEPWAANTLRKDLGFLRSRKILAECRMHSGYFIGTESERPTLTKRLAVSETAQKIIALKAEGKSAIEIMKTVGCSKTYVYQVLQKMQSDETD